MDRNRGPASTGMPARHGPELWPGISRNTQPALARALSVSIETLIDEKAPPGKRGPAPRIQQKIERLTRLPKAQQRL
ncbi:MAG: hypothetical protein ACT4UQ_02380, partial [Gammaproteobacteria bacterium]